MCSSNVSDPANRLRKTRKSNPTAASFSCLRSLPSAPKLSQQGKGRSSKRKENRRLSFLFAPAAGRGTFPRGAARSRRPQTANPPAAVQRKTPRPERANTPVAVRVPRSAGAKKGSRPSGANRLRGSCTPAIRCRNGLCPPLEHKKRNPYGFLFKIALPYQDALRTPGIWPL